jgi:hypothetical protein
MKRNAIAQAPVPDHFAILAAHHAIRFLAGPIAALSASQTFGSHSRFVFHPTSATFAPND